MASSDLQQLKILLSVRDREFAKALNKNTARVDKFAKQSTKGLSRTTKGFNNLAFAAKRLLPALSAAVLIASTKRVVESLDNIGKTADKLGLTTDALQELRAAAEGAGISSNTLDMAMQRFGRRVAEARQGTGEAKAALAEMGIELFDATGKAKDIEEVLNDVSDSMSTMTEQTDMNRLAMKLFDSEGVAMVNMLRDGSAALDNTREEMRKLGVVIDEDLIRKAEAAQTQLDALSRVVSANFASALINLAPILVGTAELLADISRSAAGAISSIQNVGQNIGTVWAAADVAKIPGQIAELEAAIAKMPEGQIGLARTTAEAQLVRLQDLLVAQTNILNTNAGITPDAPSVESEPVDITAALNTELAAFSELNVAQLERLRLSGMSTEAIEREKVATEALALGERLRNSITNNGIELTEEHIASIDALMAVYVSQGNAIIDNTNAQSAANTTRSTAIELINEEAAALEVLGNANSQQIKDFIDMVAGAESLQDALNGVLKMAGKLAATSFLEGLFGIPMSSSAGSLGNAFYSAGSGVGRASGGSVQAGGSYMVGEHGAEPFVPAQNGRILSVARAKGAISGGSGGQIAVRIFVDDAGKLAAIARQEGASAALPIAVQVVEEFSSSILPERIVDIQRRA